MSKNSTKTIFSFLLFSTIFAFIAACGDGSSTEASNDDSAMESTWVSLDNIDSSDAVMATKTLDNGIKLHFDKRELKGKEISVNYRKAMPESLQENAFGLTIYAGVEFAPGGLTFDVPIEVTLPLNKKPDTDSLLVLYYNEKERVWEATDMAVVQGKNVVFHVNHFSLYAVVDKNINDMLDYFDKLIYNATDNLKKCPGEEKLTKEVKKFVDYIDGKEGYNLAEAKGIITYPKTSCGKVEGYFASAQIYNDSAKKESFCFGGDSKKEETGSLTLIHKTDSQMGKTEKEKSSSEYQKIFDRGFSIFYGPTESTLEATASTTTLGEGETATIDISNMCGDDPMEGYVIKVKTSGNMEKVDKGDIVIGRDGKATLKVKMTDASENGWVELATTSLADEKLVTKQRIEFEADTSTAETWEMSLDVTEEQELCLYSSCLFKQSYKIEGRFVVESLDYLKDLKRIKSYFPNSEKISDFLLQMHEDVFIAMIDEMPTTHYLVNKTFSSIDALKTELRGVEYSYEEFETALNKIIDNNKDVLTEGIPINVTFISKPKLTLESPTIKNDMSTTDLHNGNYYTESVKSSGLNDGKLDSLKVYSNLKDNIVFLRFSDYSYSIKRSISVKDFAHIDTTTTLSEKVNVDPLIIFSLKEGSYTYKLNNYTNDNGMPIFIKGINFNDEVLNNQAFFQDVFLFDYIPAELQSEPIATLTLKRIK